MRFTCQVGLIGLPSSIAFASSFLVINNQGKCMIWSNNNYDCTGYSVPFANLNGDDCSNFIFDDKPTDLLTLELDICGTEKVTVHKSGSVNFRNQRGATSSCILDNGFKVGSKCDGSNTDDSHSSSFTPALKSTSVMISTPTSVPQSSMSCTVIPRNAAD